MSMDGPALDICSELPESCDPLMLQPVLLGPDIATDPGLARPAPSRVSRDVVGGRVLHLPARAGSHDQWDKRGSRRDPISAEAIMSGIGRLMQ